MSLSVRVNKFRLYMEGVLIKEWESVGLSTQVDGGLSGTISLPDDGTLFIEFVPGTKIAVFAQNQPYVSGHEKDYTGFFLLAEGVANSISRSVGGGDHGRTLSISFTGWSFFSRTSYYYSYVPSLNEGDFQIFSSESANNLAVKNEIGQVNPKEYRRAFWENFSKFEPINSTQKATFGDGSGYENYLGALYYYFAYIKTSYEGNSLDGNDKSKNREITRNIFESNQMRKKVFVVSDEDDGELHQINKVLKSGLKGHWWKYSFLNMLSLGGHHDHFFNKLSWLLNVGDHNMIENLAPSKIPGGMNGTFFKPRVPFSIPPLSNVIFPSDVQSTSEFRDYGSEPTHVATVRSRIHSSSISNEREYKSAAYAAANDRSGAKASGGFGLNKTNKDSEESLDNYAKLRGVNLKIVEDNSFNNYLQSDGLKSKRDEVEKIFQNRMRKREIEERFAFRSHSSSLVFSPFLMCGFSCVVLDKDYMTIGNIASISHNITPNSASTNIRVSHSRFSSYDKNGGGGVPNEYYDFYGEKFKGEAIKDVYSKYYGTATMSKGQITGGEKPSEIDKAIRTISKKMLDDHEKVSDLDVLDFSDAIRKRNFISESEYFKLMAAGEISPNGVYEAKPISSLGDSVFPFISEKQNPIISYVTNMAQKIRLGK